MAKRRRTGRVKVDFSVIEEYAAFWFDHMPFADQAERWTLSRKSTVHRRKDGTCTLCLIWVSDDGHRLTSTHRGLRLEAA